MTAEVKELLVKLINSIFQNVLLSFFQLFSSRFFHVKLDNVGLQLDIYGLKWLKHVSRFRPVEFYKPEDDISDPESEELILHMNDQNDEENFDRPEDQQPGTAAFNFDIFWDEDSDEEIDEDSDFEADSSNSDSEHDKKTVKATTENGSKSQKGEAGGGGDVDMEEEIVNRIIAESKKSRDHPPDIKTDDFVVDISFHPISDLLAVGLITGDVQLYKYSLTGNELVSTYETHTKACRDVEFSDDGDILYSISKDKGIVLTDVATGKMSRFYDEAHEEPIYCIKAINENLFATGDDDGTLKVWDLRSKESSPIFSLKEVFLNISCALLLVHIYRFILVHYSALN